jgi:cell wall-associated NlpC family hydrolase
MKGRYRACVFCAIVALLVSSLSAYPKNAGQPTKSSVKHKKAGRNSQKAPQLNSAGEYVIRKGDSLFKIARTFKTTPKALMSINNLRSSKIKIGQELKIPVLQSATAKTDIPKPADASQATKDQLTDTSISQPGDPNQISDDGEHPRRLQIVKAGFEMLGVRYKYGGGSEKSGFDCSGLVKSLFSQFDIELPRSSRDQYKQGEKVDRDELEIGDLVFFSSGGKQPTHVGIYVGDNKFLHAARKARQVVVSDLNKIWYAMRYIGARRIMDLWGDEPSTEPPSN